MAEDLLPLMGVNEGHLSGSESSSSDEEAKDGEHGITSQMGDITFDPQLPGRHSYLGDDMEEVSGRTIHDEASLTELPLLTLPGVVLLPGQVLPLHLFQPQTVAMIRHVVDKDKTFGLVNSRYLGHDYGPTLADIGTTAEIYSIKSEEDSATGITTVRVKAIGRQRFQIKDKRRSIDGNIMAKVLILPESVLPNPLEGATPNTYRRTCHACSQKQTELEGLKMDYCDGKFILLKRKSEINRFSGANFTHWPPWVYRMYDEKCLMARITEELTSWNRTLTEAMLPREATEFSFWVAANLPIDDTMRLRLLKMDSAVQRLRFELSVMKKCTILCCTNCSIQIAFKKDVFSMALQGPMAAYVNPHGFVHDTLTVFKASGLRHVGSQETANSWFPGYAWTIVDCQRCHQHMGWRFTATKDDLCPQRFLGLCRSSLSPGLSSDDQLGTDTSDNDWMPSV